MNKIFEAAKFEPEPTFEKTFNEIKYNHLKSLAAAAINLSAIKSLDKNFDQLCMNKSFKAEKFEPGPTFENTINDIKANHLKSIISIGMNVSDITFNKPYSSYEYLKSYLIPWTLLQPPLKIPQFNNHFPSMYPNGNTQLQIRKWCVPLKSALCIFSFWSDICQYLSISSTRFPT